ncbi:MAG: hypothetical protein IIA44_01620, partial [Acidobacteria bacterium]|nr:hypothetical protein [Acidobacteriota bacterium]
MTSTADSRLKPAADADYRAPSRYRSRGLVLAFIGLVVASIAFVGNLVAV